MRIIKGHFDVLLVFTALSTRAANSQVQEGEFNQSSSANNQEAQRAVFPIVEMDIETANGASASSSPHRSQQHAPHLTRQDMPKERGRKFTSQEREFVLESESILQGKLNWATQQLKEIDTVEGSIPLCELIKACADALRSVRSLAKDGN